MCRKILQMAAPLLAAALFLFCQKTAAECLTEMRLLLSTASLRYEQTLTERQLEATEKYLQSGQNTAGLDASFWREDRASLLAETTRRACGGVRTVRVCGDVQAAYGAVYTNGTAPSPGAENMCAVSEPLAWSLWGSMDVLGQTVRLCPEGGEPLTLTVCGVFKAREEMALCCAKPETGFRSVELSGLPRDNPFAPCRLFWQRTGLGPPRQIVYGEQIAGFFGVCAFAPWAFAAALLLAAARRLTGPKSRAGRVFNGCCAVFLTVLCVALPYQLPAWLIPNRWADAAAWRAVAEPVRAQWAQWLALCPAGKDVAVKQCAAHLAFAWSVEGALLFLVLRAGERAALQWKNAHGSQK